MVHIRTELLTSPNTPLPISMIKKLLDNAPIPNIKFPISEITMKVQSAILIPNLSTNNPPMIGTKQLGTS